MFDHSGFLIGILLGGTDSVTLSTTLEEVHKLSEEQKYSRILGTTLIMARHRQGLFVLNF